MFYSIMGPYDILKHITSHYGTRTDPVTGEEGTFHNGIDIGAPEGTAIFAPLDGTIKAMWNDVTNGNAIRLDHKGNKDYPDVVETAYAHMKDYNPVFKMVPSVVGLAIKKGQLIGYVGSTGKSTGNHLHFVVRSTKNGGNSVDPMSYVSNMTTALAVGGGILTTLLLAFGTWWFFFRR